MQENMKTDYINGLDPKLDACSKFLGDRAFFAGDSVTHPDFHMYEMLYAHNKLAPDYIKVRYGPPSIEIIVYT